MFSAAAAGRAAAEGQEQDAAAKGDVVAPKHESLVELIRRRDLTKALQMELKSDNFRRMSRDRVREIMGVLTSTRASKAQAMRDLEPIHLWTLGFENKTVEEYLNALRDLLNDDNHEVRWRAALKLGQARTQLRREDLDELERCVVYDDAWEVRCQAVTAIGLSGPTKEESRVQVIVKALQDPLHWLVRDAASSALCSVPVERLQDHFAAIELAANKDKTYADSQISNRLNNILWDISSSGQKDPTSQKKRNARNLAANSMRRRLQGIGNLHNVADFDDDDSPKVESPSAGGRGEASKTGKRGSKKAVAAQPKVAGVTQVKEMLSSEDFHAKALAYSAMQTMRPFDSQIQDKLHRLLEVQDAGELGHSKSRLTNLSSKVRSESPNTRKDALSEIGRYKLGGCAGMLTFMAVSDRDPEVRIEALKVLVKLGMMGESCAPAVITAMGDADIKVRRTARQVLQLMGQFAAVTIVHRIMTLAENVPKRFHCMRGFSVTQSLSTELRCAFLCEWAALPKPTEDLVPLDNATLAFAKVAGLEFPYFVLVEQKPSAAAEEPEGRHDSSPDPDRWRQHLQPTPAVYVVFYSQKKMWQWTQYLSGRHLNCEQIKEHGIWAPRELWDTITSGLREVRSDLWSIRKSLGTIYITGHGSGGLPAKALAMMLHNARLDAQEKFDIDFGDFRCCTFGSPNIFGVGEQQFQQGLKVAKLHLLHNMKATFLKAYRFEEDPVPALLSPRFPMLMAHYQRASGWFNNSPGLEMMQKFAPDQAARDACMRFDNLLPDGVLEANFAAKECDQEEATVEEVTNTFSLLDFEKPVNYDDNLHSMISYTTALLRKGVLQRTVNISVLFDKGSDNKAQRDALKSIINAWKYYKNESRRKRTPAPGRKPGDGSKAVSQLGSTGLTTPATTREYSTATDLRPSGPPTRSGTAAF